MVIIAYFAVWIGGFILSNAYLSEPEIVVKRFPFPKLSLPFFQERMIFPQQKTAIIPFLEGS